MSVCIFAGKGSTNLKLREDQKRGRGVYIEGVMATQSQTHNLDVIGHTYKHRTENIYIKRPPK